MRVFLLFWVHSLHQDLLFLKLRYNDSTLNDNDNDNERALNACSIISSKATQRLATGMIFVCENIISIIKTMIFV